MSKLLMISSTGPVAIQLANICYLKSDYEIDMVGRASTSENQNAYIKRIKKKQFEVKIQNEAHQIWKVSLKLIVCIKMLKTLRVNTETVVMACTADLIMTHYRRCR